MSVPVSDGTAIVEAAVNGEGRRVGYDQHRRSLRRRWAGGEGQDLDRLRRPRSDADDGVRAEHRGIGSAGGPPAGDQSATTLQSSPLKLPVQVNLVIVLLRAGIE